MTSSSSSWNRRRFLGTTIAGGAALALGPRLARAQVLGANDRIRIGVVGTGGRARYLMRLLKELPGCEMVAVSDVYEPRMLEAAEIAGPATAKHADYRRLLDDKDVHAVADREPRPLAPEDGRRRDRGRQGRVPREARLAHARGRRRPPEARRGHEAGRPDRHAAAELGALRPRQADRRLGQAGPDHLRPHLLAPADGPRRLAPGGPGEARLDGLARLRAGAALEPRALLPLAALPGLRRRRADRPPHPLDRRRALVPRA